MSTIKNKIKKLYDDLTPFKDVIWFLFLFIFIDFVWKLCVKEMDEGVSIFVLGKDFTQIVEPICLWTAHVSHWIVQNIFGCKDFIIDGDLIYFAGNNNMRFKIVWECTGVKQMVMFGVLIALYYGPAKKKLWFIPLSMMFLNLINIIRIVAVVFITKDGFPDWFIGFNEWYNGRQWDNSAKTYWLFMVDWFELFHKDVFRWLYYNGVMFLLWLTWEEVFNLPYRKLRIKAQKNKELSA